LALPYTRAATSECRAHPGRVHQPKVQAFGWSSSAGGGASSAVPRLLFAGRERHRTSASQPMRADRPGEALIAWAQGSLSPRRRSLESSVAGREPVAGGRTPDQPADQATAAERQRWKHVHAAIAPDIGLISGAVVRLLFRETPDLCRHPIPPEPILLRMDGTGREFGRGRTAF
jgi:hypothetical protein